MLSSPEILARRARVGVCRAGRVRPVRGVTLIELLIVLTIVAILAVIAYPSYRAQVQKTRRADAEAVLMQAAQYMERLYSEYGCYNPDPAGPCIGAPPAFPFTKSPIDGSEAYYAIALQAVAARAFTISATPQGVESGAGVLDINETGRRGRDRNGDGDTSDMTEDSW